MKIGGVTITRIPKGGSAFDDRTNWTQRQIPGSEKKAVFGHWFGAIGPALLGSLFFWFGKIAFFFGPHIPNPVWALMLLVSFCMLIKAIWETIRLKRFGDPMLELSAAPIPLGGTVEGRLNLTSSMEKAPEFTITIACIHRVQSTSGKNGSVSEKILWSGETKAALLLGGILPISIAVPADQPQTNAADPFDRILWRLTVRAPFRGQAFLEKYEIPVGQVPVRART